jgi:serine/threonine-protein kinase
MLYAEPAREPVPAHLDRLTRVTAGDITYQREGTTWIVVSGYKGSRIFYRKTMLPCGGRAWHYLEFEYPATQKRAFDRFVTRASAALGAYTKSGCRT